MLVVLVLSAFALAQLLFRFDKLDALDPLDHLVTELILNAQTERGAVHLGQRLAVHLAGQKALWFEDILQALCVIVGSTVEPVAKGEKSDDLCLWSRPDELDQSLH